MEWNDSSLSAGPSSFYSNSEVGQSMKSMQPLTDLDVHFFLFFLLLLLLLLLFLRSVANLDS